MKENSSIVRAIVSRVGELVGLSIGVAACGEVFFSFFFFSDSVNVVRK